MSVLLVYLCLAAVAFVIILLPAAILALLVVAVCRLLGISFDGQRFKRR
ncbi:MAG: hypothetical protein JW850_00960 [Thermoflexales bacterium]|nr:hypothetical protein [Thermoflexales bacterium]